MRMRVNHARHNHHALCIDLKRIHIVWRGLRDCGNFAVFDHEIPLDRSILKNEVSVS